MQLTVEVSQEDLECLHRAVQLQLEGSSVQQEVCNVLQNHMIALH